MKGTKLLGFYGRSENAFPDGSTDTWVFTEEAINRGLNENFRIEVPSKILTEYVNGEDHLAHLFVLYHIIRQFVKANILYRDANTISKER